MKVAKKESIKINEEKRKMGEDYCSAFSRQLANCPMCGLKGKNGRFVLAVARALSRRYCLASNKYFMKIMGKLVEEVSCGILYRFRDCIMESTSIEYLKKGLNTDILKAVVLTRSRGAVYRPQVVSKYSIMCSPFYSKLKKNGRAIEEARKPKESKR